MARITRTKRVRETGPTTRVPVPNGVYQGVVKDNRDEQRMGRLRVWVPEFGSLPDYEEGWITVSYCSPFAGATDIDRLGNNTRIDDESQTSYGFWAVPPDIGNIVIIMFINNDPTRGIWIGSLYQQFMNNMVPGIAAGTNFQHGRDLPTTEYNKRTKEKVRNNITRPELREVSESIAQQGLINDTLRGTTTSSARREAPSQVYGLLTPGPEREGHPGTRVGGSQFVMDDGEGSEKIRLRTRSGAQVLIDETNGIIYAINKKGTAWIQMDEDGNVDVFGAESFSVRAQQDINLRADRDINIEAGRNINSKAVDGNTNVRSGGTTNIKTDGTTTIETGQLLGIRSQNINATAGEFGFGGTMRVSGGSFASDFTTPEINLNNLNGHTHGGVQSGGSITAPFAGSGSGPGSVSGPNAFDPPTVSKTNVLPTFADSNNFNRDTYQVLTIVGRFITYEPCPEHKNKG